jgi:hypothetical protein
MLFSTGDSGHSPGQPHHEMADMRTSLTDVTILTHSATLRRERETRQHYLEQIETGGAPLRISLDWPELLIGRAEDAHVRTESQRASRYHASLTRRGTDYVIRDNDSQNGVFLNGVKIQSAVLREGDIIQIADCTFIYREG